MEKFLDKLPFNLLGKVNAIQMLIGAAVIGAGLAAAYYFTLYGKMEKDITDLEKKIVTTQAKVKKYQREVAQKPLVRKTNATLVGTLSERKRQMPTEKEIIDLLHQISEVGEMLDLKIKKYKLGVATDNEFYKEIPVDLEFKGGFYNTAGFFDNLQNLLRLVNFHGLKMNLQIDSEPYLDDNDEMQTREVHTLSTKIQLVTFAYIEGSEELIK